MTLGGRFENMPTNLVGLSPIPMPTFSSIPQSMMKRIAGQLWRSASILELPKMTPVWPLTPNSWTSLLFPPPPPTWWSLYRNITKIHQGIFKKKHFMILDTHAISSLNSLSPFALPPPKFWCWCHHCYYLLINRKHNLLIENYTFYRKTYISYLPYTLHHYHIKPHELGCFESIYSAPLLFVKHETQISKQKATERICILTQALIICENTYINLILWLQF